MCVCVLFALIKVIPRLDFDQVRYYVCTFIFVGILMDLRIYVYT